MSCRSEKRTGSNAAARNWQVWSLVSQVDQWSVESISIQQLRVSDVSLWIHCSPDQLAPWTLCQCWFLLLLFAEGFIFCVVLKVISHVWCLLYLVCISWEKPTNYKYCLWYDALPLLLWHGVLKDFLCSQFHLIFCCIVAETVSLVRVQSYEVVSALIFYCY